MYAEAEIERVRRHTSPEQLKRVDETIERNIKYYGTQPNEEITRRIEELQREWSIERYLDTNASALALAGALLGLTVSKKWLLLTAVVSGFLFQHAIKGWCPPVPILRRLGFRTVYEIEEEREISNCARRSL